MGSSRQCFYRNHWCQPVDESCLNILSGIYNSYIVTTYFASCKKLIYYSYIFIIDKMVSIVFINY